MLRIASSALTVLLLLIAGIGPAAAEYPERPLTILTGYPAGGMVDIVAHFDLARHFVSVHGAEPGGRFDAKADLLAHLVGTGVIRPDAAIMVGDRASDIAAARLHGLRSIGALWGYGDAAELAGAGADLLCERPHGLAACVSRLGN